MKQSKGNAVMKTCKEIAEEAMFEFLRWFDRDDNQAMPIILPDGQGLKVVVLGMFMPTRVGLKLVKLPEPLLVYSSEESNHELTETHYPTGTNPAGHEAGEPYYRTTMLKF